MTSTEISPVAQPAAETTASPLLALAHRSRRRRRPDGRRRMVREHHGYHSPYQAAHDVARSCLQLQWRIRHDQGGCAALEARIHSMNAMAKVYRTRDAAIEMEAILGVNAFDLDRALKIDPEFLEEDAHEHDETVGSIALVEAGALDGQKLNAWLSELLQTQGPDIFRLKGILNIDGEDQRFVFQGVHMLFDGRAVSEAFPKGTRPWKPNETRKNELVLIGRNLDEAQLRGDFRACLV